MGWDLQAFKQNNQTHIIQVYKLEHGIIGIISVVKESPCFIGMNLYLV